MEPTIVIMVVMNSGYIIGSGEGFKGTFCFESIFGARGDLRVDIADPGVVVHEDGSIAESLEGQFTFKLGYEPWSATVHLID